LSYSPEIILKYPSSYPKFNQGLSLAEKLVDASHSFV